MKTSKQVMIYTIILIVVLQCYNVIGQHVMWNYSHSDSYFYAGQSCDMIKDNDSNLYILGRRFSTDDAFLVKLNSEGDSIWEKEFPDISISYGSTTQQMAIDSSGNVYFIGHIDLYISSEDISRNDISILKIDPQGTTIWSKTYSRTNESWDWGKDIAIDKQNNIIVTGQTEDREIIRKGDCITLKYNSSGDTIWTRTFDSEIDTSWYWDDGNKIVTDDNDNIFIACSFGVLKYSSEGNLEWSKVSEDFISSDEGFNIKIDNQDNIIYTSRSNNNIIKKYDQQGNEIWSNNFSHVNYSDCRIIAADLDKNNNLVISGAGINTAGDWDLVTVKLDSNGVKLWEKIYNGDGNSSFEYPAYIVIDSSNNSYITGSISETSREILILKYDSSGNLIWEEQNDYGFSAEKIILDTDGVFYVLGKSTSLIVQKYGFGCPNFNSVVQQICMVTVDTLTSKNLIVWEPTLSQNIAGTNIYRETSSVGIYEAIGYVPVDSISVYIDTSSDPSTQPYKYKIVTVDTCGNESPIDACDYHKTIHLQASLGSPSGIQLSWTEYNGFDYTTYNIYGREKDIGNFELVHEAAYGMNTWTDNTTVPNMEYIISVNKPDPCNPSTLKNLSYNYDQSLSNIDNYSIQTGIPETTKESLIYLYSNPNNGIFTVKGEGINSIIISNLNGEIVFTKNDISELNNINLSDKPKGMYLVKILTKNGIITKKVIII